MFKFTRCILALALGLLPVGALRAQDGQVGTPAIVVELFTSQGCSSCPPADALLTKLAAQDDVLALALHVDYWDYIGWKDHHAQPKFTRRQRAYAQVAKSRMVYTPQMVIGGQDHVIGTRPMEVVMGLDKHRDKPMPVALRARRAEGTLWIAAEVPARRLGELMVQIVQYVPEETVAISRGENRGKTITYTNIVTSWELVERWSGDAPLDIQAAISADGPVAVLVQEMGPGEIVAALRID